MKILDINDRISGCVATVGSFDGIHLGHRKIFEHVKQIALDLNLLDVIITFRQHPRFIVQPGYDLKLLTTIDEKISLLDNTGIGMVQLLNFDRKMALLEAEEFVRLYLVERLNVKALVVGFNHRLGRGRGGNYEELVKLGKKYGFSVHKVNPVLHKGKPISSSRIRKSLESCQLDDANKMLGYKYFISGQVVEGKKLGKKIGFPTANLRVDKRKLMPCPGVYAVYVEIDSHTYKGVLNYGRRPTIENDALPVPEVHIINFSENVYNKTLKITLVKHLREERKFSGIEKLKNQIFRDIEQALSVL